VGRISFSSIFRSVFSMSCTEAKQVYPVPGAADRVSLAAAPGFASMALLTSVFGAGAPETLCSAAHGASPLGGMAPMYLLMSAFHLVPWLKLFGRR
jgi:hypothetical protein